MLMGLSGHDNIRSLSIYVNVSAEAVAAALEEQTPPAAATAERLLCPSP
ncbi:MAG TPA: hypothetical protein VG276_24095 [Actinomycetes bacterium]|nr:hypothetical protein [Actinomycetes bacterium]